MEEGGKALEVFLIYIKKKKESAIIDFQGILNNVEEELCPTKITWNIQGKSEGIGPYCEVEKCYPYF